MLYPYSNSFPAGMITGDAARRQLIAKSPTRLELYADFLDLVRFPGEPHEERTAQYLTEKYADKKPDVVVTLGPEALRFILKHRDAIAPMAPIVFAATSSAALTTINPPTDVTGVISDFDLAKTMALAERLQPSARHLVVVTGASEFDRRWVQTAQRQLARFEQHYETRYLVGLEHDALLDELKRLPRDTIVILTTIFADGAGRLFVPPDISEEVAKAGLMPATDTRSTHASSITGNFLQAICLLTPLSCSNSRRSGSSMAISRCWQSPLSACRPLSF
jgi:hypothetical protein